VGPATAPDAASAPSAAARLAGRPRASGHHREGETRNGIIGWIILGLIAGAIARALHSGDEPGGFLGTLVAGILGAVLGGLIASAVGIGSISSFFSVGTWLIAIGGALLLLVLYNAVATAGSRGGRTAGV